ncbi:hypothetical protein GW17_00004671 [Ensete ventricosum]|nr:hypothetical protein GW17_00004671 [Ensete ventricosum]
MYVHKPKDTDKHEHFIKHLVYILTVTTRERVRGDCLWYFVPDSGFLRTLDSSIRRNTAVIKKLKQINDEQREGLLDELRSVNLSKFVSEAVAAICDAKLRASDIQAAVQVHFEYNLLSGLLQFFKGLNVTADQKKFFKKALHSYYDAVTELLLSEHNSLRLMELENAKVLSAKGELSDENAASYEKLRKSFDHLFRGVCS